MFAAGGAIDGASWFSAEAGRIRQKVLRSGLLHRKVVRVLPSGSFVGKNYCAILEKPAPNSVEYLTRAANTNDSAADHNSHRELPTAVEAPRTASVEDHIPFATSSRIQGARQGRAVEGRNGPKTGAIPSEFRLSNLRRGMPQSHSLMVRPPRQSLVRTAH